MTTGQIIAAVITLAVVGAFVGWRRPVLAFGVRTTAFMRDVRGEIRKVTWPTVLDLRKSTTVIVIFVLIVGVVIGVMDKMFSMLLIDFLGRIFE